MKSQIRTLTYGALAVGVVAVPGALSDLGHQGTSPLRQAANDAAAVNDRPALADDAVPAAANQQLDTAPAAHGSPSTTPTAQTAHTAVKKNSTTASYRVRPGDTLSEIALEQLGAANRYDEVFELNKNRAEPGGARFTDPNLIDPGWVLTLPSGTSQAGAAVASSTRHSDTAGKAASTNGAPTRSHSAAGGLSSWIEQARTILKAHGIQVSSNAIYQTAMHESGGNPDSVNRTDSNAAAGHPSIGLMQTIKPTFDEYALPGHTDIYNPVDNILAAVRYADANYGSLDEVVAARCGGGCWRGY